MLLHFAVNAQNIKKRAFLHGIYIRAFNASVHL